MLLAALRIVGLTGQWLHSRALAAYSAAGFAPTQAKLRATAAEGDAASARKEGELHAVNMPRQVDVDAVALYAGFHSTL